MENHIRISHKNITYPKIQRFADMDDVYSETYQHLETGAETTFSWSISGGGFACQRIDKSGTETAVCTGLFIIPAALMLESGPAPTPQKAELSSVQFMDLAAAAFGGFPQGAVRFDAIFDAAAASSLPGMKFIITQFNQASTLSFEKVAAFLSILVEAGIADITPAEKDAVLISWPNQPTVNT